MDVRRKGGGSSRGLGMGVLRPGRRWALCQSVDLVGSGFPSPATPALRTLCIVRAPEKNRPTKPTKTSRILASAIDGFRCWSRTPPPPLPLPVHDRYLS